MAHKMKPSPFLTPLCVLFPLIIGCQHAERASAPAKTSAVRSSSIEQLIPGSSARITFRKISDPTGKLPPFWIAETETTWNAYDPFLQRLDLPPDRRASVEADPGPDSITRPTPPYSPPDRGWGHNGYPALGITFHGAKQYCQWLSDATGKQYRLPTVAEWKAACGSRPADIAQAAWGEENANETSHAVRGKRPNAAGLYDMFGNVAEWCTGSDGKPVVCGGSFVTPLAQMSPALFEKQTSAWQQSQPNFPKSKWWLSDAPFVGFRLVFTEEPIIVDLDR